MCFCWEEKLFYFLQQDYRKWGILHSWIANRLWGNCIALVTQNCLSINQSTNQTINTLRRNQSQQPFQTSRNQFSFSLSNLPEAHRQHSLSLHTHLFSLSLFLFSFQLILILPRKNRAAIAWLYLNFFGFFLLFSILFLTSVGFYDLLDFILLL